MELSPFGNSVKLAPEVTQATSASCLAAEALGGLLATEAS